MPVDCGLRHDIPMTSPPQSRRSDKSPLARPGAAKDDVTASLSLPSQNDFSSQQLPLKLYQQYLVEAVAGDMPSTILGSKMFGKEQSCVV